MREKKYHWTDFGGKRNLHVYVEDFLGCNQKEVQLVVGGIVEKWRFCRLIGTYLTERKGKEVLVLKAKQRLKMMIKRESH